LIPGAVKSWKWVTLKTAQWGGRGEKSQNCTGGGSTVLNTVDEKLHSHEESGK